MQINLKAEYECDAISEVHDCMEIAEDSNALRVICKLCKNQYIIRKHPDKGNPELREYAKIFRRHILQPKQNLFYKVYPQHLRI